jgi:glycosyltransferase involved in cell wall biosynthesis
MTGMRSRIGFDVSDLVTNRADGTTRYTAELARRLPELDLDSEWIYFAPGDAPGLEEGRYTLKTSPWPKYWTQSRLPWDLYKYRPDVLFMPIQQIPFVRPGKMKTVAVVHDLAFHIYPEQFTYKDWALQHIFTSYVCREADRIIAVSQATVDDVARFYGREENVSVVHHGLNAEAFYRSKDENERQVAWQNLVEKYPRLRKPYLLYVGQIQPRKNLIRLIEAFEHLADRDKSLQLVLAGSHGWLNKPIFEKVEQSSHKERILMPGRVPDRLLRFLYWQAEVFVLPSLYEGFGMPVVEAMAISYSQGKT